MRQSPIDSLPVTLWTMRETEKVNTWPDIINVAMNYNTVVAEEIISVKKASNYYLHKGKNLLFVKFSTQKFLIKQF